MADINDVSAVIASALAEVSVAGTLDVTMDGRHSLGSLGSTGGDDVDITVVVTHRDPTPVVLATV